MHHLIYLNNSENYPHFTDREVKKPDLSDFLIPLLYITSEWCLCKQMLPLPPSSSFSVLIYLIFKELDGSCGEERRVESQANLQRSPGEEVDPLCSSEVHNVALTTGR